MAMTWWLGYVKHNLIIYCISLVTYSKACNYMYVAMYSLLRCLCHKLQTELTSPSVL